MHLLLLKLQNFGIDYSFQQSMFTLILMQSLAAGWTKYGTTEDNPGGPLPTASGSKHDDTHRLHAVARLLNKEPVQYSFH
jgi:hypothetical protein